METLNKTEEKRLDDFVMGFEKQDIDVPEELEGEILKRIDSLKKKRYIGTKVLVASLVLGLLMISGIKWNPTFASYAENIPGLDKLVELIRGDQGIENARRHGYDSIQPYKVEKEGITLVFNNIFIDEDRLSLDIIASGKEIKQIKNSLNFDMQFKDFEGGLISSNYMIDQSNVGEDVLAVNVEKLFDYGGLKKFLASDPQYLEFDLKMQTGLYEEGGEPSLEKYLDFENIKIPFKQEMVMLSKEYSYGEEITIEPSLLWDEGKIIIDKLIISPTRIQVIVDSNMEDDFFFTGLEEPIIKDDKGKEYKPEGLISREDQEGKNTYFFVPSIYFDDIPKKLYLSFDGIRISQETGSVLTLNLDEKYPKTHKYMGLDIEISNAFYKDGNLIVKLLLPRDNLLKIGSYSLEGSFRSGISSNIQEAGEREEIILNFEIERRDEYEIKMDSPGYLVEGQWRIPLELNE